MDRYSIGETEPTAALASAISSTLAEMANKSMCSITPRATRLSSTHFGHFRLQVHGVLAWSSGEESNPPLFHREAVRTVATHAGCPRHSARLVFTPRGCADRPARPRVCSGTVKIER